MEEQFFVKTLIYELKLYLRYFANTWIGLSDTVFVKIVMEL